MTVQDVLWALDQAFPFALAEEWDNVGLLLGDARREVSGCVVALDATEEALDFARARGARRKYATDTICLSADGAHGDVLFRHALSRFGGVGFFDEWARAV